MFPGKKIVFGCTAIICTLIVIHACKSIQQPAAPLTPPSKPRLLVFTKTNGFYHESIPTGAAAMIRLAAANNFSADTSSNSSYFNSDSLRNYSAVMFLNTTMNVLNADQQVAFERYIQSGGGYVGVHAATDTEYDWPWYNRLVGAYFASHPKQQTATINVLDTTHPSTRGLPLKWTRFDEWYNFKNVQSDIKVLANLDETTYEGGQMGESHPFAWYHEYDGGRAFYTAGGHTKESYADTLFMNHVLGGIRYAFGNNVKLDESKAYAVKAPEDNRFTKTVLSNDLNEPMELAVANDGRVFFTERSGKFYMYNPTTGKTLLLHSFPTKAVDKYLNGLIGITLDPDFSSNDFIYFFYSSSTGDQFHQNVSRFKLSNTQLDLESEKILIKIPIDLEVSAHTGGSLAWDKNKNLYISTGDNTVPFESDGYAPIDERNGRHTFDAQRSSANTNDLRGKILRIHPEADGTYTIPEGNLFAKGTANTKPEIYVMGCRNPYRIAVDPVTSIVYWGEIGPDAGRDSQHGPRGYDEFNQARAAGNFGWPYFVGNNRAYKDSNFATKEVGAEFDFAKPVNNSPNNTGLQTLPPAQKPMIWYPYNRSEEFPVLGDGGRCAMGGPIYRYNSSLQSGVALPAFFDKTVFVYDWMRNWVFAARLNDNDQFVRLEPFMQSNGDFRRPVDMEFGADGSIYMLEYGSVYGIDNVDARLVRITYNAGNRVPVPAIAVRDTVGTAPLTIQFSGDKSVDPDDEPINYSWFANGKKISSSPKGSFVFDQNGSYDLVLTVTDQSGKSASDTVRIHVGNTLPLLTVETKANSSFFFPNSTALPYSVNVVDKEDLVIDTQNLNIRLKYLPKVADQSQIGHQQIDANYNYGKNLMATSDCKACHQLDAKSVGPSFTQISKKYGADKNAPGYLANKIITGGGGVWGEHAMNAHPQLSKEDATEIVRYILSVTNQPTDEALPKEGTAVLNKHLESPGQGRYILSAAYTDKGGANSPLTGQTSLILRPSKIPGASVDGIYNMQKQGSRLGSIHKGSYFIVRKADLKDVDSISFRLSSLNKSASIEVRMDGAKGKLLGTLDYTMTGAWNRFVEKSVAITDPSGKHDLYFVFNSKDSVARNLASVDWIQFKGGKEWKEKPVEITKSVMIQRAPSSNKKQTVPPKSAPAQKAPNFSAGKNIIAENDCGVCHTISERMIGPSYKEIAEKYKNTTAVVSKLADKIISGGSGAWGQVPMTPHPQLSKKECSDIVKYILSLK